MGCSITRDNLCTVSRALDSETSNSIMACGHSHLIAFFLIVFWLISPIFLVQKQQINLVCPLNMDTGSHLRSELLPLQHRCSCLGFQLTFECNVTGEAGATVWGGSIFHCPSTDNTITLRHSVFTQLRGCNNGAILGRGIYSQNSCYISQINVTITSRMNNGTVQCVYNNGSATTVVSTSVIKVISGNNAIKSMNNTKVVIMVIIMVLPMQIRYPHLMISE